MFYSNPLPAPSQLYPAALAAGYGSVVAAGTAGSNEHQGQLHPSLPSAAVDGTASLPDGDDGGRQPMQPQAPSAAAEPDAARGGPKRHRPFRYIQLPVGLAHPLFADEEFPRILKETNM